jgi:exo-beta-1,3-glucanase (GH17 family)
VRFLSGIWALIAVALALSSTDVVSQEVTFEREEPFVKRPFYPFRGERWIGNAIAYGPFRDGQYPGGPAPSKAELREDLRLMTEHWNLLRLYGSTGPAETILEVIREDGLDMKVMLGVWIDVEERRDAAGAVLEQFPEVRAANRREVESAVRLANLYPEIILSVSVGNETQVFWSAHRVPPELLIGYVRRVRAGAKAPVTVADDFNYWNKPESRTVARELDFIVTHIHPLWNGIQLEDALQWTQRTYAEVRDAHPGHTLVLGETGWATGRHDQGEQARLIKGETGEEQQKLFYETLTEWTKEKRIPTFFFEAFDENWKGGEHPNEVEKHWGLYRADRTPKRALAGKP